MTRALALYKKHSKADLLALSQQVESDPDNQAPPGELFQLTPAARKKVADIAQAITWHMEDDRAAADSPVPVTGYSGRQSNREARPPPNH